MSNRKTIKIIILFSLIAYSITQAQIDINDFTADFESGNIANVEQVGIDSFTFEIEPDPGDSDTYGWFYFAITGNIGRNATLFLTNPDIWQTANCAPVTSMDNVTWNRVGNIWQEGEWVGFRQYLNSDTVWFAQGFPFTVSKMSDYLDSIDTFQFVNRDTIGYSVQNRPIELITIIDSSFPDSLKRTVFLMSRQHPMESPPTFLLTGLIDAVLDSSPFAFKFRRDLNLFIVPIINVDGVVEGLSRHNVNGYNLNRVWRFNINSEEPELQAVHQWIDDYITGGGKIDFFLDMHASPSWQDFGFRLTEDYTSTEYYDNQTTFLNILQNYDPWETLQWAYHGTNGVEGVATITLYNMYDADMLTPENAWTRRNDYSYITIESLYEQGPQWAAAIYDYLYPLRILNIEGDEIDSVFISDQIVPTVNDYDQRDSLTVEAEFSCAATDDSETIVLDRQDLDGLFSSSEPLSLTIGSSVPDDGIFSVLADHYFIVSYTEPAFPQRICSRPVFVMAPESVYDQRNILPDYAVLTYPNPFNSSALIQYMLYDQANIKIEIYDILGRRVVNLLEAEQQSGKHQLIWNAHNAPSGIYFYRIQAGDYSVTKRMMLLK